MKKSGKPKINNDTIFELYHSGWESYSPYLFLHSNKTEAQFKKDVKFLLRKYGHEFIESKEELYVGVHDWIIFILDKMSELGYREISTIGYGFFEAEIIYGNADDDNVFGKVIGKELLNEAAEHNRKINEEHTKYLNEKYPDDEKLS